MRYVLGAGIATSLTDGEKVGPTAARARREPVRKALRPSTSRQIEQAVHAQDVTDQHIGPAHVIAAAAATDGGRP